MNTRIRNHLGRTTIILNQEDYGTKFMEHKKNMDHINYQKQVLPRKHCKIIRVTEGHQGNGKGNMYIIILKQGFTLRLKLNTLNIFKDHVNRKWKTFITQNKLLDLVFLFLTTIWYPFNSKFQQKTDGVAIERPASSTMAETCTAPPKSLRKVCL